MVYLRRQSAGGDAPPSGRRAEPTRRRTSSGSRSDPPGASACSIRLIDLATGNALVQDCIALALDSFVWIRIRVSWAAVPVPDRIGCFSFFAQAPMARRLSCQLCSRSAARPPQATSLKSARRRAPAKQRPWWRWISMPEATLSWSCTVLTREPQ